VNRNASVSRYPRMSLPIELKNRFEIQLHDKDENREGRYKNIYNDKFWFKSPQIES
jgi:hypothetical protein